MDVVIMDVVIMDVVTMDAAVSFPKPCVQPRPTQKSHDPPFHGFFVLIAFKS